MKKRQPKTEVVIDGDRYFVQLYSPTFGLTLYARLLRLLGKPIIDLIVMLQGELGAGKNVLDVDLAKLDLGKAADAIQTLFSGLSDEEFPEMIKAILSSTFVKTGDSGIEVSECFEDRFAGEYLHLFKLVAATLGAQYPDFLGVLKRRASAANAALASAAEQTEEKATE